MTDNSVYVHWLTPIANMLITSEALLCGKYGALTAEQQECLEVIHTSAVQTYAITKLVSTYNRQAMTRALLKPLAHDWLTPSGSIVSLCDYLLHGLDGDLLPEQFQKVRQIFYQAHFLQRQTHNMLDYGKILTRDLPALTTFELKAVLTPDLICVDTPLRLQLDIPETLPPVYSTRLYVVRTLSNLLANAFTFTRTGQVTLRAWHLGSMVEVSVSDTGCGIPRRSFKNIFQPFYKIDPHSPGIGLGLYIAKTFTELQGGRLGVESVPGQGSTFAMTIPAAL